MQRWRQRWTGSEIGMSSAPYGHQCQQAVQSPVSTAVNAIQNHFIVLNDQKHIQLGIFLTVDRFLIFLLYCNRNFCVAFIFLFSFIWHGAAFMARCQSWSLFHWKKHITSTYMLKVIIKRRKIWYQITFGVATLWFTTALFLLGSFWRNLAGALF